MAYGDLNTFGGLSDYSGAYTGGYQSTTPGFAGAGDVALLPSATLQDSVMSSMGSLGGLLGDLTKWDTARRLSNVAQQNVSIASRQRPQNADATTRAASAVGSVQLGDLLPFVVVGGLLWLLMK